MTERNFSQIHTPITELTGHQMVTFIQEQVGNKNNISKHMMMCLATKVQMIGLKIKLGHLVQEQSLKHLTLAGK